MKVAVSAISMSITGDDLQGVASPKFFGLLVPLVLSVAAWTFILVEMVFAYRNADTWLQTLVMILYAFLYSLGFTTVISVLSSLFWIKPLGFIKALYLAILTNLPVVIIAIVSLIMKIQFGMVRVLGHFPEHALVLSAYITILSQTRFISLKNKIAGIVSLVVLTVLVYILLGPVVFVLFQLT